jgi:uncharacterized coiled-coil protein SlyX
MRLKKYYLAKRLLNDYADITEPRLYPELYETLVKKSSYDILDDMWRVRFEELEVKLASKDSDIEFLNSVIKEREFLNSVHLKTLKELEAKLASKDLELTKAKQDLAEAVEVIGYYAQDHHWNESKAYSERLTISPDDAKLLRGQYLVGGLRATRFHSKLKGSE